MVAGENKFLQIFPFIIGLKISVFVTCLVSAIAHCLTELGGAQMPRLAENLPNRQPPYQLQIRCNDQQVQPLGSNLFNEPRKLRRRGGPIPSLDRLFLSAQQPPDEPDRNTPEGAISKNNVSRHTDCVRRPP